MKNENMAKYWENIQMFDAQKEHHLKSPKKKYVFSKEAEQKAIWFLLGCVFQIMLISILIF